MRRFFLLLLSGATVLTFLPLSASASPKVGYGFPIGRVGPCSAKYFDNPTRLPLIVILLKGDVVYAWYNVTADPGTNWYHFDVPTGQYSITTTYSPGTSRPDYVGYGKSPRRDFLVSCSANFGS